MSVLKRYTLDRDHDSTIVAEHCPRLDTGDGHYDTLNMHICSLFRLGSHLKGNRCLTIADLGGKR